MADIDEANREEGELSEEGELPDDEQAEEGEQAQEDSEKPAKTAAKPEEGMQQVPAAASTQEPVAEEQQQPAEKLSRPRQDFHRGREGSFHDRDRRDSLHNASTKGGQGHDRHREREHERHRTEREKAELMHELDRLTYDLSFQDIRGNWVGACQDLKTAIKKLDKLLRRVKKKREDDVELYPAAYNYSTRVYNALKHVIVICSTGLGKLADMELANALMRTAVNYRHDVFSLSQKRELEQQLRDSKEFRHLFTDRDRGRSNSKANGAAAASAGAAAASAGAAATATAGAAGSNRGDGEQRERPRLQRGQQQQAPLSGRSDGMQTSASKDDAVSEASHAAAGVTSSRGTLGTAAAAAAASDQAPPSPPGTASAARSGGGATPVAGASLADAPSSGAPSSGAQDQAAPAAGYAGSSGWGSGGGTGLSSSKGVAAASKGPQIRIVLNSTSVAPDTATDAAGAGEAAGGIGGAGAAGGSNSTGAAAAGSGGGLKRPMPQIQDLDAEEEEAEAQQQAAKRVRHHEPDGAAAAEPSAMNGVSLSELPEVVAAMNNPGQLQVVLQNLLSARRLCLVLDLDHTLVNSAKFAEVDADWEYKLEQLAAEQLSRPKESRDLHRLSRVSMWTKLRPGVREFLRRAAERFELWIYTAGSKVYADAMVELLDPSGQYFGGRVIAQGVPTAPDETPADAVVFKRLMQGLEGREPVVVIVDDSSAVWPHDRQNLFVVERYIYFPSSRKRFGMQGKSLLEIDRDECPSRGMLMTALRIFEHLHDLVFARMRSAPLAATAQAAAVWDVRSVMAAEKRQVLAGVNLVFSRVIPLESNPRQHPLWQLAEQFGATCGEQCTDATTHVVATHGGTEKVMWAKQNNVHVVSPAWLECSCILWRRANEDKFPTPL